MKQGIVVIDFDDVAAARQVAAGLPSYTTFTFDPVLVDTLAMQKFQDIRLLTWDDCPDYADLERWSHGAAYELERELEAAAVQAVPQVPIASWQHLNLFYLLMKLKWFGGMWPAMVGQLGGYQLHIVVCDKPSDYNFPSFLPAVMLMQQLQANAIPFSGYVHGSYDGDACTRVPQLGAAPFDAPGEAILTHLPTCFYDLQYFHTELCASGKRIVNLKSRWYDLPLPAHADIVLEPMAAGLARLEPAAAAQVAALGAALLPCLDRGLAPLLPIPAYRARQASHLASLYASQLCSYFLLERHFSMRRPSRLLLADRDMGLHGPLLSFAQKHALPVLLLPHSKTTNDMEYRYRNLVALSHPIQGAAVRDPDGRELPRFALAYPEQFTGSSAVPAPLTRIALLLNTPSASGIYFTNYQHYMAGLRQLIAWGKERGVAFDIRCKPSYTLFRLLSAELGLDPAALTACAAVPMEDYARGAQLCLMYDAPTSGAVKFLATSIPILNPVVHRLSANETSFISAAVVPRDTVAATLAQLDGFVADPVSLFRFRCGQFRQYLNLFEDARPLRAFL